MPAQVSMPNSNPGTYQGAFTTEISAQPSQNRKPRAAPPAARMAAPARVLNVCSPAAARTTCAPGQPRKPRHRDGAAPEHADQAAAQAGEDTTQQFNAGHAGSMLRAGTK